MQLGSELLLRRLALWCQPTSEMLSQGWPSTRPVSSAMLVEDSERSALSASAIHGTHELEMDSLVEKIANPAYEIVGVIVPRLVGLFIAVTILATWLLGIEVIRSQEVADVYRAARGDPWVSVPAAAALSYLIGHFLLWFSKEGWTGFTCRVRPSGAPATKDPRVSVPALRFLLLMGAARPKKDVHEDLVAVRDASAEWLVGASKAIADSAKNSWRVFYLLATKAIAQARASSLVDSYRNKYACVGSA